MAKKLDDFLEEGLEDELDSEGTGTIKEAKPETKQKRRQTDKAEENRIHQTPGKKKSAGGVLESPWLIFALTLTVIQLIASAAVLVMLFRLNILPGMYMAGITAGLVLFLILDFLLLFWIDYRSKDRKRGGFRRIFAAILAGIITLVCIVGTAVLDKVWNTMNLLTSFENVQHVNICVYVREDDPAESMEDAENYTFGITTAYDYENTLETIKTMESDLGHSLTIVEYDSVLGIIDALYSHEVDAIILNQAYEDVITGVAEYSTFTYDTRILHYNSLDLTVEARSNERTGFDITKDPFIVYISGSDTRAETLARSQSDVNIICVVNPSTRQVLMVNTPRDFYIPISIGDGQYDKLTHAGIYGAQVSIDTLDAYYGIEIDYYAQINFVGFEKLIDALGGVEVNMDSSWSYNGVDYEPGNNLVDGETALKYARDRYSFADGDRARGRHQMALLKAIFQKIAGSATLINKYNEIIDSLEYMFITDVTNEEVASLIKLQLKDMSKAWSIATCSVTGSDSSSKDCYSWVGQELYVMIPDQDTVDEAILKIEKVLNGEKIY